MDDIKGSSLDRIWTPSFNMHSSAIFLLLISFYSMLILWICLTLKRWKKPVSNQNSCFIKRVIGKEKKCPSINFTLCIICRGVVANLPRDINKQLWSKSFSSNSGMHLNAKLHYFSLPAEHCTKTFFHH